uniref:Lens fiber membrane intrinsic protein n=1 Tax=Aquarana catesbeiana TaxID=8400 RepID=C1C4B9_AQUCT|nr:Lens fiber membrane intrinsic protein [Aquarana catesbeiana]
MSYAKLLGLTFSCVSFVMNIIALVGTYWLRDNASKFLHEGIWQQCMNNTCLIINGKEYIDVTRTFILLSSVVLQFVMVTSCLAFFDCPIGRFTASFVSFILNSISAVFLLIALVVYTLEEHLDASSSSARYGWAYFLCWTSVLFSCIAAFAQYRAHRSTPATSYEPMQEGEGEEREESDNLNGQS